MGNDDTATVGVSKTLEEDRHREHEREKEHFRHSEGRGQLICFPERDGTEEKEATRLVQKRLRDGRGRMKRKEKQGGELKDWVRLREE